MISHFLTIRPPPGGRSLAVLEHADTLKVIPIEGGQARVVHKFNKDWGRSLVWSPDGKYFLYAQVPEGEDETGGVELWRIPAEGGEPVKLPLAAKGMENVRIHPDGNRISFNTVERKPETWVMENFLPIRERISPTERRFDGILTFS